MQIYEIVDEDSTIARCDREKTLGNSLAERFFTVNFRENHLGEIVNQSGHSVIVKESGVLFVWSLDGYNRDYSAQYGYAGHARTGVKGLTVGGNSILSTNKHN